MKTEITIKTLAQLIDEQYGEEGTLRREEFEEGFLAFKLDAEIQDPGLDKL